MSLLGDEVIKLLLRNNTISVRICPLNHLLQDSIISQFPKIFSNLSQIFQSDESYIEERIPVFWESKVMKTLWTSSRDSLSEGRVVII